MPNIIDASLKFISAGVMERQQFKPTELNDEGKLVRPEQGFKSLIRLVLRRPIAEKDAVKIIWAIGIVFGVLGIIVALSMPGVIENKTLMNFLDIKEMSEKEKKNPDIPMAKGFLIDFKEEHRQQAYDDISGIEPRKYYRWLNNKNRSFFFYLYIFVC